MYLVHEPIRRGHRTDDRRDVREDNDGVKNAPARKFILRHYVRRARRNEYFERGNDDR